MDGKIKDNLGEHERQTMEVRGLKGGGEKKEEDQKKVIQIKQIK